MNRIVLSAMLLATPSAAFAQGRRNPPGRPAPMAVEARFTSPGNGIFRDGYKLVTEVARQEKAAGNLLRTVQSGIGREGEITVCLQFSTFQKAYEVEQLLSGFVVADNAKHQRTQIQRLFACPQKY